MVVDRSINILNEDCLIHIFEFLSFKDRMMLEEVSRQWKEASLKSWMKMKALSNRKINYEKLNKRELINSLKRCAPFLKKILMFREQTEGEHAKLLSIISIFCKNLSSVEVFPLTSLTAFYILCDNFDDIKDLDVYFGKMTPIPAENFPKLLDSKTKLQKLELYEIETSDFEVPGTVEDFTFRAKGTDNSLSPKLLKNLTNLRRLQMEAIKITDLLSMLPQICADSLNLLELRSISGNFGNAADLRSLVYLRVFRLISCKSVTNKEVENIARNCKKLKEFTIDHCRLTTSQTLESAANLPKLETLIYREHTKYAPNLNTHFKCLRRLQNLKRLEIKCRNSITIFPGRPAVEEHTNTIDVETVCDLIAANPKLESLDLKGFDFSRNNFQILRFAEEITRERTNGVVLQIHCRDDMPEFQHESPYLVIFSTSTRKFIF